MNPTVHPPFPDHLDDTMLSAFRQCPTYWYYGYLRNLRPKGDLAIDLIAGGAYARGLEVARTYFFSNADMPRAEVIHRAQVAAIKHWGDNPIMEDHTKNLVHVLLAIEDYFGKWGVATDPLQPLMMDTEKGSRPCVEFSFALPIGINHPDTGAPILYTGKLDMLAMRNETVWIMDDKTSSNLGPQWLKSWDMRSQFSGYTWAAYESGLTPAGVCVRGCAFTQANINFAEAFTFRPRWMVDQWLEDTRETITRMIECWEKMSFPQAMGSACNAYNRPCRYTLLCSSREPENWVPSNYDIKIWNPLTVEEV